jgi:capsular polysaccharide biosynthesis protein
VNQIKRQEDIKTSTQALNYLENQLEITNKKDIKDSINLLIEEQLKIQMLANLNEYYFVKPIDQAFLPEVPSSPNRFLIIMLGIILGIFSSILAIFFKLYFLSFEDNT